MSLATNHFADNVIDEIRRGLRPMTDAEREYLCRTVPRFEESTHTAQQYRAMSDVDLMNAAYGVWCDYTSGMY